MGYEYGELALEVEPRPEADDEELAELARRLRTELLDLDVEAVKPMTAGETPEGAKGVELLAIGGMVVKFVLRQEVLTTIVDGVRGWLRRQSARSVKITLDGDSLEITGATSAEQDRLVELWVARHATAV
jgi:hypothetical protein